MENPSPASLSPGDLLGIYEIVSQIGEGGMGTVYKARDTRLGRFVAIKRILQGKEFDDARRRRFVREARAISAINHPNIVVIHAIETEADSDYLVMELIEGRTLHEAIRHRPLTYREVLDYATGIAAGLSKAHGAGIVHRDLKPSNVMITRDHQVKLLDFGLAKLTGGVAEEVAEETRTMDHPLTVEGMIVGTTPYMSPEQAQGRPVDDRSDIFAFGAVLYEMLSGRRAFQRANKVTTMAAVICEPPPDVDKLRARFCAPIIDMMEVCLRKDPELRYQKIREVHSVLEDLLLLERTGSKHPEPAEAAAEDQSSDRAVAVLPFSSLDPDARNVLFSEGLTEDIITSLSKVPGLRVTGRTSAFAFQGREADVKTVADKLHVANVLRGTVRTSPERIRVTAQLVDAQADRNIWSERYDRRLSDIFEIQDEISSAIVDALTAKLTGSVTYLSNPDHPRQAPAAPRAVSFEAHEAFLRGRFFWNRRTWESLRQAIDFFERAIRLAPGYALAHVGLADAYNALGYYGERPPEEAFPRARKALMRALQEEPSLGEAHASLGFNALFQWNWIEADIAFEAAVQASPNYASAHQWMGWGHFAFQRFDKAVACFEAAHRIDPLSPIINTHLGLGLLYARGAGAAIPSLRETMEMFPDFATGHQHLGAAHLEAGDPESAIRSLKRAVDLSAGRQCLGLYGLALGVAGRVKEATQVLERLESIAQERYLPAQEIAFVNAGLGDLDRTFAALERAVTGRSADLVRLPLYPWPNRVFSDPRFERLLERMHFPGQPRRISRVTASSGY